MNNIISHYEATNLIAYIALLLAYLAYRKTLLDEIKNWNSLILSFKSELFYASSWIGNSYTTTDSNWSNPSKVVYPLTFESVKAIISKGHPPQKLISKEFLDKLAFFNERVEAFNYLIKAQLNNYVFNSLSDKQTQEKALYINEIIHKNMIGSKQNKDLFSLYNYFDKEIIVFETTWNNKIGIYLKYPWFIFITSLIAYLVIDYWL